MLSLRLWQYKTNTSKNFVNLYKVNNCKYYNYHPKHTTITSSQRSHTNWLYSNYNISTSQEIGGEKRTRNYNSVWSGTLNIHTILIPAIDVLAEFTELLVRWRGINQPLPRVHRHSCRPQHNMRRGSTYEALRLTPKSYMPIRLRSQQRCPWWVILSTRPTLVTGNYVCANMTSSTELRNVSQRRSLIETVQRYSVFQLPFDTLSMFPSAVVRCLSIWTNFRRYVT